MTDKLRERLERADMVLVGLGEEFDGSGLLKAQKFYLAGAEQLRTAGADWLLPAWQQWCLNKVPDGTAGIRQALEKLKELLEGKNYFVVSVSANDIQKEIPWREGRLVTPCGGSSVKQCSGGCKETLEEVTDEDREALQRFFVQEMDAAGGLDCLTAPKQLPDLGRCVRCGKPLILNNVHAPEYNEAAYLPQWQHYTKWLQGTLHRELLLLELGVGLRFPSVVRWPFEKTAFFHQKAFLFRVHETLYQIPEELREKSTAIPQNSIDWLRGM